MTLFKIVTSYLKDKLSSTLLYIIIMALGIALMTSLLLFTHQINDRLYRDTVGVDAIVGAKGSPLQLILSSLHHIDIPTGNIKLSDAMGVKTHRHVRQAIPISLGDSYHNFRIIGTEPSYLKHFNAKFSAGEIWHQPMQAVIGANVAKSRNLNIGDTLIGAHGLIPGGSSHNNKPYNITGILEPTGTVIDRLVVTSLESVWNLHGKHDEHQNHSDDNHHSEHEHEEHKHDEHGHHTEPQNKEITALLIKYRSRAAALSFPRMINQNTSMQAVSPAFEMAKLFNIIGVSTDTIFIFSALLITITLLSIFIGMLNNSRERKYDLAIFRTLGASRITIMKIVLIEGMTIILIGSLLGILIGHGFIEMIGAFTAKGSEIGLQGFFFLSDIWVIWGGILLISVLICLIPAWRAYKVNIHKTLTNA